VQWLPLCLRIQTGSSRSIVGQRSHKWECSGPAGLVARFWPPCDQPIVRWNAGERAYWLRQVVFGHEGNLIFRCMSATRILWGQILVVLTVVLVMMWAATQWTAWRLGYQPQLGQPWFELAHGVPVYLPPAFFWWWYVYDAYAPRVFVEGACIAASGGIISIVMAFAMSVWRAREAETAATYGSATRLAVSAPAQKPTCSMLYVRIARR
jgi:hypothetical protein